MLPILRSSCAQASTAAEARFRIDAPIGGRSARIIALDAQAGEVVGRVARRPWGASHFLLHDASAAAGDDVAADVVLRGVDGAESRLSAELDGADVAIMVATASARRDAAATIAQACSLRGIMTAGLVLGERAEVRAAVAALRPYARVLLSTDDEDDVVEVLRALRA